MQHERLSRRTAVVAAAVFAAATIGLVPIGFLGILPIAYADAWARPGTSDGPQGMQDDSADDDADLGGATGKAQAQPAAKQADPPAAAAAGTSRLTRAPALGRALSLASTAPADDDAGGVQTSATAQDPPSDPDPGQTSDPPASVPSGDPSTAPSPSAPPAETPEPAPSATGAADPGSGASADGDDEATATRSHGPATRASHRAHRGRPATVPARPSQPDRPPAAKLAAAPADVELPDPQRVPSDGSDPTVAPPTGGADHDAAKGAGWLLTAGAGMGPTMVVAGMVGLIIAVSGLVTVTLRRRSY